MQHAMLLARTQLERETGTQADHHGHRRRADRPHRGTARRCSSTRRPRSRSRRRCARCSAAPAPASASTPSCSTRARTSRTSSSRMMKMNRGRAFFTTPDTLGDYVLVDFLEHRQAQPPRQLTARHATRRGSAGRRRGAPGLAARASKRPAGRSWPVGVDDGRELVGRRAVEDHAVGAGVELVEDRCGALARRCRSPTRRATRRAAASSMWRSSVRGRDRVERAADAAHHLVGPERLEHRGSQPFTRTSRSP